MGEKLKIFVSIISGIIVGLGSVVLSNSISINDHIPFQLAQTLFDSLIQINVTILGFWGIIFVFFLKVIHDNRRNVATDHLRITEKMDEIIFQQELNEERFDIWETKSCQSYETINTFDVAINNFMFTGALIVILFLISIFSSILFIGHPVSYNIHKFWFILPVATLFLAIFGMFLGLWMTTPDSKVSEEAAKKMRAIYTKRREREG